MDLAVFNPALSSTRLPDNEPGRMVDPDHLLGAVDRANKLEHSHPSQIFVMLIQRGDAGNGILGLRELIAACNRNMLRALQAAVLHRPDCADGNHVIHGNDGGWQSILGLIKQLPHRLVAVRCIVI